MTSRSTLYGSAALAVALLVIEGTVGVYYYTQYAGERVAGQMLVQELKDIDTRYALLAANYNGLLSNYSRSISLLSRSIAVVNTSQPVYREASRELSALWREYLVLKPASTELQQDSVLVDFANGTRSWYNNTQLQPGWNLYIETVVLMKGNVVAQWFPQYGSHLVSGIGGAGSTSTKYWFIWTYDDKTRSWQQAQVGADQLQTQDGSVFAWTLCAVDQNFQPNCKP